MLLFPNMSGASCRLSSFPSLYRGSSCIVYSVERPQHFLLHMVDTISITCCYYMTLDFSR